MRERCGAVPDVVLFWEGYHLVTSAFLQLYQANFCVAIFCEDLHWFHPEMRATKMLALAVADVILASYAPVFERFFPDVAAVKRIVWVPHAASPEFLLPLNRIAENVIFLSGMINDHYPLRQRLKALAERRSYTSSSILTQGMNATTTTKRLASWEQDMHVGSMHRGPRLPMPATSITYLRSFLKSPRPVPCCWQTRRLRRNCPHWAFANECTTCQFQRQHWRASSGTSWTRITMPSWTKCAGEDNTLFGNGTRPAIGQS